MTVKEALQNLVTQLPDDADWDDVDSELYVIRKVMEGEAAIARGECVSNEEARARIARCLEP